MTFNEILSNRPDKWTKATVMETLVHLQYCKDAPRPIDVITPTPKIEGSTYGADSIRIGGSPAFINAVLARLTDMLEGENQLCRLSISRATVKDTEINGHRKNYNFAGNEVVYIQVHDRGPEAIGVEAVDGATDRFINARPKLKAQLEEGKRMFQALTGEYKGDDAEQLVNKAYAMHGLG